MVFDQPKAVRMMILDQESNRSNSESDRALVGERGGEAENFAKPSRKLIVNLPPIDKKQTERVEEGDSDKRLNLNEIMKEQDAHMQEWAKSNEGKRMRVAQQLASIETVKVDKSVPEQQEITIEDQNEEIKNANDFSFVEDPAVVEAPLPDINLPKICSQEVL